MINVKEFRIGNLLQSETGEILPVAYTTNDNIIGLDNGFGGVQKHQKNPIISYDIDLLKPIPLTEEWLLKFGFTYKSYGYGNQTWKQWCNGYMTLNGFEETCSGNNIEYVHTLQNLYFALTGQELQLTNSN